MKSNWPLVKLEEVADLTVGFVGTMAKHYTPNGVTFLRSTNIDPFDISLDDIKYISPEFNEKLSKSQLRTGDVVIVRTGKPGACAVIPNISGAWNCSDLVIVRPHAKKLDPLFLAAYINVASGTINNQLVGAVQQHFNVASAKRLEIPLPSIDVQRKISSLIGILNDKINLNNKINDNLQEQALAVFQQELLRDGELPEGWSKGSLLDIANYLNGLAMQKFRPADGENGLPVLKIKELRQGSCDTSSELCSPSIKPEYIVHDGDVIFSWSGSLLVDLWCGGTCGLNQHLFKVTSEKYPKWFYYAWTAHHLARFVAIAADKATTMGHIKREELAKAEVVIPDAASMERIGGILQPMYDLIISNRIENRKLAALRDTILPQLMSGELDVGDLT